MKSAALVLCLLLPLSLLAVLPVGTDMGKVQGSPHAPVVLEIFSSFDCPHCKVLHEEIVPRLVKEFVTAGKLVIVSREFPLTGPYHPYAQEAALMATAAARIGKYEPVASALFLNQATWAANGQVWETVASALTLSEQNRVKALAQDPGVVAEVQRDMEQATRDGVNQTPYLFMTAKGKRFPLPPGVPSYELLRSLIQQQLK